jgi:hypothetical protein
MSITAADARPSAPLRAGEASRAGWFASRMVSWLVLPALVLLGLAHSAQVVAAQHTRSFFDYKGGLYEAGVKILHGANPYRAGYLAHQAAIMHAGGIAVGETSAHVFSIPLYPAPANLAIVPLSLLPYWWSAALYTVLAFAAMWLGVRLLGVRDWRCHAMWLVSWPFLFGALLGAIGPFIVLGAAIAWRWRARLWPPALSVGALVAVKIFPWTLVVWLLITRRWRALALAVVSGLVLTFGAWAVIGFHGLADYPRMLSDATFIQEGRADGVATVLLVLGASARVAQGIALLTGIAALAAAWRALRLPDGDRRAFGLAIIAALVSTPIVWDHYMVLLFVPIALLSPRFSRMWLLPAITPTLITLSFAVFPLASHAEAASPDALHYALGWLAAQAILGTWLSTTAERRAQLAANARARVSRRPVASLPAA